MHVGTFWQAASGIQSIVLSRFDAGAIFQDVPTTPEHTYRLRFAMSGSTAAGSAGPVKRMQVSFGNIVLSEFQFDVRNVAGGHFNQNMGWRYFEQDVVASAATTRLRFASWNAVAGDGPALDDVSLALPGQPTPTPLPGPTPPSPSDICPPTAPFFPETGFCIDNPAIQAYFQARGGVDTFGFPVSRSFVLLGFPAQVFQRHVLRVHPDGVKPVNLLDPDVLPVTTVNFATFPANDPALLPADLRAQVHGSRFFNQYCPNNPAWLCRPAELPGTDLTAAFQTQRQ